MFLTWSQSDQDVVDSYTISYMGLAGCSNLSGSKGINGSLRNYNVTDLEEAMEYTITIRAVNIQGPNSISKASSYVVTTLSTSKSDIYISYQGFSNSVILFSSQLLCSLTSNSVCQPD